MDISKTCFVYFLGLLVGAIGQSSHPVQDRKKGALIGKLKTFQHDVEGTAWALGEDTLYLENFHYDGIGPDAFFWMGEENQPSPRGFIVPYPIDTPNKKQQKLPRFQGKNLILRLPPGKKIVNMKYLSVWCRRFTVDFGHVLIPDRLSVPKQRVLPELKRLAHGVRSGNVTILDAKTIYIPNLHYDGGGPDAFFWVGKGSMPNVAGQKVPNEMNSYDVLRGYEGVDIEIQLPDDLTVYDIDYLSIWCVLYKHNFGHVLIPPAHDLWVPPALGQTKVNPHTLGASDLGNCLEVSEDLQVEWQARDEDVQVRLTARIQDDQYIAFGLSGDPRRPKMLNSDVVVAYFDRTDGSFHAVDYSITSLAQCDGTYGVCPDERVGERNDAAVITGEHNNGITTITYTRPYTTGDPSDIPINRTSEKVAVVASIGPLNTRKEANFHSTFVTKELILMDFMSEGEHSCRQFVPDEVVPEEYKPWPGNVIENTHNFSVIIGPTGGQRGYSAITGSNSWGIAFWLNDLLIPEIHVERGETYYFTIETGNDAINSAQNHPFYITESSKGGLHQKTMVEKKKERFYAGVRYSKKGVAEPTAYGRFCSLEHKTVDRWRESVTFQEYRNTLSMSCDSGKAGLLTWTVMEDTPDTVYYQCYTHQHLGWKIHVHNSGFASHGHGVGAGGGAGALASSLWLLVLLGGGAVALR